MDKLLEQTCNIWSDDSLRLICPPCILAKETFLYLQEIGYFKTTPPYSTERANLPSFLVIYTLSGTGVLEINGKNLSLTPGSCMFIDCMQHHRYYTKAGSNWEFLWAHFYGAGCAGYLRLFSQNDNYIVQVKEDTKLKALFWDMIHLQQNWCARHELSINQQLITLLTTILLACESSQHAPETAPDYIRMTVREIERNCTEHFLLEETAEKHHVSKFHFSRTFKQHMGMTFSEYVIFVRLRHAKEMLKYTDLSVNAIALKCGFNDTGYFIRAFRKKEGYTPLVYRKYWKT